MISLFPFRAPCDVLQCGNGTIEVAVRVYFSFFTQPLAVVERISNSSVRLLEGAAVGQP